jgi:hypothetical protein
MKEHDGLDDGSSLDGFVRYTLAKKEDTSSTCSVFTLRPATASIIQTEGPGLENAIKSVQFKQPQLQIARNYTLLPSTNENTGELGFLIRKELKGEVSGYLHRLPLGSELELRGPIVDYILPQDVDRVLFLAGGTGIAPALQVAEQLAGRVPVHIMWANRRREDCKGGWSDSAQPSSWSASLRGFFASRWSAAEPATKHDASGQEQNLVVARLDRMKEKSISPDPAAIHPLQVDYFVDDESSFIRSKDVQRLLQSSDQQSSGKKLLLVSGPEGFINHWAGPKQWQNGREVQGPLGGTVSSLDLSGWHVVKL